MRWEVDRVTTPDSRCRLESRHFWHYKDAHRPISPAEREREREKNCSTPRRFGALLLFFSANSKFTEEEHTHLSLAEPFLLRPHHHPSRDILERDTFGNHGRPLLPPFGYHPPLRASCHDRIQSMARPAQRHQGQPEASGWDRERMRDCWGSSTSPPVPLPLSSRSSRASFPASSVSSTSSFERSIPSKTT